MKLEKVEKTALKEALDDFRDGKNPVDDLDFNDKITVEMPYFSAKALQDIQNRDAKLKKILEPVSKAADELLKDTEAQKTKSEKESKSFKLSESYLKENFDNRWTKNENTYTVKCNGRKDLRQLIAEAKAQGIKYKFNKLLDEDYKYDFIYTIEGGLQPVEENLEEGKELKESQSQENVDSKEEVKESLDEKELLEGNFHPMAHKVIVDKFWSKDEYDDTKDFVYVILPRQKVFIKVLRKDLFDNGLHYGTFIDQIPVNGGQEGVDSYAQDIINKLGAKKVSIEELKNIENETKDQDVAQAFAHAEKSFREDVTTKETEVVTESMEEKTSEPKGETTLTEAFDVIGNLTNYTPWGNAVEIWEVIKGADKVEEFDTILTDLYPNGLSLNELNDFLSTKEDIVRTLLDLDKTEPVEEVEKVEVEEEPISKEDFEAEDDNIDDIESLVDEVPEVKDTTEEERAANRERFLNTETGFDEEDEDDISDIASLA